MHWHESLLNPILPLVRLFSFSVGPKMTVRYNVYTLYNIPSVCSSWSVLIEIVCTEYCPSLYKFNVLNTFQFLNRLGATLTEVWIRASRFVCKRSRPNYKFINKLNIFINVGRWFLSFRLWGQKDKYFYGTH